ncbi:hypothetical protein PS627_01713 [Pseudomonas fluorescens]|uniref:hypothetical protein n=1 Tax=Pseudomonas fluorescens TaxID=294 RepID=UPI0012597F54|nr:hypothetical protein [Pseudomonas fluorescens]CAG8865794.1 hypothetical protein PS627_01713 [Pseudomonas fluorescens]VVP88523.1 hypothetical protein PS910_02656 [Pseudomonas fluorescens]
MAQPVEEITIERDSRSARPTITVHTSRGGVNETRVLKLSGLSNKDADAFLEGIELMTMAFNVQLKALPQDKIPGLVNMLIPLKPARPTLLREAKMLAKGKTRILQSGDWLTAQEVAELAQFKTVNASSQPNKWKRAGKIFALRHEGTDYFPIYGLDPSTGYRARAELASVISVLAAKKDGWGMAFWFGSSNSMLGGRLPKDVLKDDPGAVLEAAKDEVCGVLHG